MFTVSLHAIGCLPDSEAYPCHFDTAREAWAYIADEIEYIADDGDYLAAHTALHVQDRAMPGMIPADESGYYNFHVYRTE